ncbi:Lysozyme RrrD [compost metagenome]
MNLKQKAAASLAAALVIALPVVKTFEGRSLVAYLDPVRIPTICDGWTHGVRMGDQATSEQCDALTRQGLDDASVVLTRWVPAEVVGRMSPRTVAAFLSFIYNVGPGMPGEKDGFVWLKSGKHSTMLRHLQAGRIAEACAQLPFWVNAGDRKLRGLERRRAAERQLCEAGL